MGYLEGKVALVTGTARYRGIGRASARALAREGANLVITDLQPSGTRNQGETGRAETETGWQGLDSLAAELEGLGRKVLPLTGDVSRTEDVERMVAAALSKFGRIDVLLNNAGAPQGADRNPVVDLPDEAWDLVMGVNVRGTFVCTRAVLRDMIRRNEGGRIVNVASIAGKMGMANSSAYCASKFAVIGFTQSVAQEVAKHGITVNAVCPGIVHTSRAESRHLREDAAAAAAGSGEPVKRLEHQIPMGRAAQAEDIANMVAFFASPAASYITGQAYNVSGGLVMH